MAGGKAPLLPSDEVAKIEAMSPSPDRVNVAQNAEPPGLDEFLSSPISSTQLPRSGSIQPNDEPPGLDQFLSSPSPKDDYSSVDEGFRRDDELQSKYGDTSHMVTAALEGAGQGYAGPVATLAERAAGRNSEDARAVAEANPIAHAAGEFGGFAASMLTGVGEFPIIVKSASGLAKILGLGVKGASTLNKIGATSLKAATEMALLQAGDETSKMIQEDPNQTASTAAINIGMSGLLGGVGGAALGSVSPLWKATAGDKLAQVVEDFRGRIAQHIANPDPVAAVTEELGAHYAGIRGVADEVYGASGLKAQDIAKAMPELSDKMLGQMTDLSDNVKSKIDTMLAKPNSYPPRLVSKLQSDLETFQSRVSNAESAGDIFNAAQDMKQSFQGYAKYDKFVKPVDEAYDFVRDAKNLAFQSKEALEDPYVWGKAAERQKAINKAFTEFKPALDDFEKKFTVEVGGERQIDPGKINTYVNQLGKPNAEIKQQMLDNFLKASDKYKTVIGDTHANLGIDNPIAASPLNATYQTLDKLTTGAKLADLFIKKGLSDVAGKTLGAAAGATIMHSVGLGGIESLGIGALLGEHTLGPFFTSVMPALVKPFLKMRADSAAVKAAVEYTTAAAKGAALLSRSSRAVFNIKSEVLPDSKIPIAKDRQKLDKMLKSAQANPIELVKPGEQLAHYLPEHSMALAAMSSAAVNYLNSLRPDTQVKNPLDGTPKASSAQIAIYNRALDIAEQPLIIFKSIKDGTLNSMDIKHLTTLFPNLYHSMKDKLLSDTIDHVSKGESVPYKTRLGLSLFTATPMDSTMTPQGIQSSQSTYLPTPQPNQPGQDQQSQPKRSTSSLSKLPKMYQTPGQAGEADRSSR